MRKKIARVVNGADTRTGRAFDLFVQFVILLSVVSLSVETIPELSPSVASFLRAVEVACVVIFTLEYALRFVAADSRRAFVFSFFAMVDLLATAPYFLMTGVDLRSIRVVRMVRLVRIFKLFRYNNAIRHFRNAFFLVREELILFMMATLFLLYIAAVGIYYFENEMQPKAFSSVFDSLWWAVATLTTVGYGDVYPVTVGGRVFTFLILIVGLGFVSVPSAILASAMSRTSGELKEK